MIVAAVMTGLVMEVVKWCGGCSEGWMMCCDACYEVMMLWMLVE